MTAEWSIELPVCRPGSYAFTIGLSVREDDGTMTPTDHIVNAALVQITAPRQVHGQLEFPCSVRFRSSEDGESGP